MLRSYSAHVWALDDEDVEIQGVFSRADQLPRVGDTWPIKQNDRKGEDGRSR